MLSVIADDVSVITSGLYGGDSGASPLNKRQRFILDSRWVNAGMQD